MNVIVLGKVDNGVKIVERQDYTGMWYAIKYGDWDGWGDIDWWTFDEGIFARHNVDYNPIEYPLVPVEYDGQYVLACCVQDYELDEDERLVKAHHPASGEVIKKTLQEMWG